MLHIHEYEGSGGHRLRYGVVSDETRPTGGPALLFLPGLGGSVKGALNFLEHLQPAFCPIYGPDLRGFGLNPLETPLAKAAHILDDLEAFYQQVLVPANHSQLFLCGISLGGVLASLLAARHPERYRALMLLAPAFKPHASSFSAAYVIRNTLSHLFLGPRARTTLPYGMSALTANPLILNDPQYQPETPLLLTPGFLLGVRALSMQAMRAMPKLTMPTLMVVPGQDIVCDPAAMRAAFAKLPASTPKHCQEYPHFYHDVLFEAEHPKMAQDIMIWLGSSGLLPSVNG